MAKHLSLIELKRGLPEIVQSPQDGGVLSAIVVRPETNKRESLGEVELSRELGVHGDNWSRGCWLSLPDGRPHPDVQVTIMNARAIALIAQQRERWELACDNLYVDMDLSEENLPCGQQIQIGTAVLEITTESHSGCHKFAQRFGADATKFVNSAEGKRLHLRGVHGKICQAGVVRVGDEVRKLGVFADRI